MKTKTKAPQFELPHAEKAFNLQSEAALDGARLQEEKRLQQEATAQAEANQDSLFGPVIYTYTRKQALADGAQVDVTETAKEAGIKFPTFMNRTVWDTYVEVPPGVTCQDERGRLWDIVMMMRFAISRAPAGQLRINFQLRVRNKGGLRKVTLSATVGPVDIDNPAPAITIMRSDED